uniref:BTB domain containing 9 n=1 Tax=Molossus molossus TaxID=27622 RepID=A0A7J8GNL6_MOLMO|nr:BTB domain containing 9 [Molossus molossus]
MKFFFILPPFVFDAAATTPGIIEDVQYIRIVGTHNTVNKIFHIVAFECMFTNQTFTLEKGLIVPMENVATIADCASVIEGVSRSRNALLNGDTKNYDWDSGYTCHQLGSGAIVVQLAQPYMIGSIRCFTHCCLGWAMQGHGNVPLLMRAKRSIGFSAN